MSIKTYLAFDTETGGLDPEKNPLLQIGIGVYSLDDATLQYTPVAEREWLVNPDQFPGKTMEPPAMEVNKLNPDTLKQEGLTISYISSEIAQLIKDTSPDYILGQNIPFDLKFLRAYLEPDCFALLDSIRKKDLMDTSEAYNLLSAEDPENLPRRHLGSMCERLDIKNDAAHTALSDARATFQAMVAMFAKFRQANTIIRTIKLSSGSMNSLMVIANSFK